jgi:hypothetical protein
MAVRLSATQLAPYRRFSLYNSPYVAHDDGSAVDLYPHADADTVPSPVAGEVLDTRTVRAPPQPYAEPEDHLVLVDTGAYVARLLHVEPSVAPGETVARGDPLGRPVRAGFFAPWVPNHLHLEFRPHGADPYRASGSLRLAVDVDVTPLPWDGTGTVVEAGKTWARLDSPSHPAPGEGFAGLRVETDGNSVGVLDGGLPHYDGGGLLGPREGDGGGIVRLAGQRVGTATGRDVTWDDVDIVANGEPVRGIACYADREDSGVKLVGREVDLAVGEDVSVTISR